MADDMKLQIILEGVNDATPAFDALNDAIKSLTNAATEFSRTFASIFADPSKEAAQQIRSIGEGFKSVETSASEAASAVARDFEDAAKKSEEAMAKVGNGAPGGHGGHGGGLFGLQGQMDSMYAGMGMGAMAFPFVEAIKSSIETFAQFDQAVHNVASMMPEGTKAVKGMEDQLMSLSQVVPQSATDLAKGLYGIVGAGVPAADAMNVLKVAAEAAAGGQTDVGTASNALIFVLDSYGMSAKEAAKVSDELFAANQSGAMTFPQLANAIGTVSGAAAQAGIGFDQVAAATAALSNQGLSAQRATMGLRALLMGIMAPTAGATKEAHALGIEWDANALKQKGIAGMMQEAMKATGGNSEELKKLIPNIAAWTVAMDLGGKGAGAYKQAMDAMANSTGATQKAMETQEQGAGAALERFHKTLQNLQITFAQQILPTINDFLAKIEDMMNWFGHLSDGTKKLIGEVALGAGAFLTFGSALFMSISGIGALVSGFKALGGVLSAALSPWGLVTEAVVAAGVAAYEIYTHWDDLKKIAEELYQKTLTGLRDIVNDIKQKFIDLKDQALQKTNEIIKDLTDTIEKHKAGLEATATVLGFVFGPAIIKTGVEAGIAGTKLAAEFTANVIKSGVEAVIAGAKLSAEFIASVVKAGAEAVVTGGKLAVNLIASVTKLGIEAVATAAKITGQMVVALVSFAAEGWAAAAAVVGMTTDLIAQGAAWVAQKAAVVASTVATGVMEAAQWALNVAMDANPIGIVIIALGALGAAIYEVVKHFQDICDWVEKAWNWLTKWNSTPADNKDINVNTNYNGAGIPYGVPAMAKGGVVDRPTLALIGEGGEREYVIPESKLNSGGFVGNLAVSSLDDAGYASSSNFTDMFAQGLTDGISKITDASKQVAQSMFNHLGFHSPTKDGPGSDADRWAPNFIDLFAGGLKDGVPAIADASSQLSQEISNYLGFHSPTPMGAGADADTWAPSFISMLSQGLLDGVPKVKNAVTQIAQTIKDAIDQMIQNVSDDMKKISNAATTTASSLQSAFTSAFDTIAQKAQSTLQQVQQAIQQMQQATQNVSFAASSSGGGGGSFGTPQSTGLNDSTIGSDGLTDYTRAARQAAIDAGGVTASSGGIPGFATGGRVTRPTLAWLGEDEPETIIPDSFFRSQTGFTMGLTPAVMSPITSYAGSGFGGGAPIINNYITVQGHVLRESELTNIVSRGQWNKMKWQGKF